MTSDFGFGGDERNRTADPLLARQVLSQLSYTPTVHEAGRKMLEAGFVAGISFANSSLTLASCLLSLASCLVGLGGLEPPTSRLSGVRSDQLSYRPIIWLSDVGRQRSD